MRDRVRAAVERDDVAARDRRTQRRLGAARRRAVADARRRRPRCRRHRPAACTRRPRAPALALALGWRWCWCWRRGGAGRCRDLALLDDADQRIAAEPFVAALAAARDGLLQPGRPAAVADRLRAADREGLALAGDARPAGFGRRGAADLARLDDADQRVAAEPFVAALPAVRDGLLQPGRAAAVADGLRAADREGVALAGDARPAGVRRRGAADLARLDDADCRIAAEPFVAAVTAAAHGLRDPVRTGAVADRLRPLHAEGLVLDRDTGPAGVGADLRVARVEGARRGRRDAIDACRGAAPAARRQRRCARQRGGRVPFATLKKRAALRADGR